ncbi:MAG TPA: GFA family protein [Acidobacteriota bacterium]|nr:GFA family protein [Acidobacteriota bacterium]
MKLPLQGGCVCGAVRYESRAEPIATLKCHCRDCQRVSGSPHVCAVLFPTDAFRFTRGQPKYFCTAGADGGRHQRGFCADCGSRLTGGENPDQPAGFVGVTVGSLDDASWFRPQMELWLSDAHSWDPPQAGIPHFVENPPSG